MNKKWQKILYWVLFLLTVLYTFFLTGKIIRWIVINPQIIKSSSRIIIPQTLVFAITAVAALSAIRQKNKVALTLSIIPLIYFLILCVTPHSFIKLELNNYAPVLDKVYVILDMAINPLTLLILIFSEIALVFTLIKSNPKSPKPPC